MRRLLCTCLRFVVFATLPVVAGFPALGALSEPLYSLRRWTTEDGLPAGGVVEIVQTRDGYLWLGTRFGLVRFDGARFKTFDKYNSPGLQDDAITGLASSDDGTLWVATPAGLIQWRSERVIARYGRAEGLPTERVWQLAPRAGEGVWWRAGNRAGFVAGGRCVAMKAEEEGRVVPVERIRAAPGGGVLATTLSAVHAAGPGGTRLQRLVPMDEPGSTTLFDFRIASDGAYWRGGAFGVERMENGTWSRVGTWPAESQALVDILAQGSDGVWWAATRHGDLRLLRDGEWVPPAGGGEVDRGSVTCLFEDRERCLWIGTERQGIARLGRRPVKALTVEHGLPHREAWSVAAGRHGEVWVGTASGLARIRDGRVERPPGEPFPSSLVRLVLQDASGTVWLATSAGIWRYHGEDGLPPSFDRVEDPLLGHGSTGVLFEDRDRRLWLNADRRMLCVQEGVLRESAIPDLGNQVRAMLQARDGSLWFGTYGAGAWRMTGRAIARITNGISIHERVWAFHEDASGTIWMGTEHGLKRWRDDRCDSFGMREGLLEELVNHVVGDDTGHLWLSGLRGIYRVSSDDLDSVAAGRRHTVRCTAYGSMDGLLNPETNGEMQPAGCRTADGHLWFPTMDGVAMIDPAAVQEESFAPQAMIEGVAASGAPESETVPPGEVRILPAGSGRAIRVRYTACVFSSASRVRFRHRLLPHHAEWIDGARERVAYYTNLRPGDYRFEVIAANPLGVWSKEPAVLSFRIEPFLWQTPAFVGICVAVGIAIIGGVVAYHSVWQRRVFRLEQGRLLERERARIADDLHDELGANLTGLALKAELARSRAENPVLGEDLASIASTARSLTDATREIIWLASPRHDSLDSLAGHLAGLVERLAASGGLRCRLDVPPRLPPLEVSSPVRHQICLAVKEAVHNALKHSAASAIHFRCQLAQDHVVFEVSDDGRGLPATSAPGRGNGLSSMRERVEHAVGGTLGLRSAPGQGTSVEIRVPCAQLSRRNRE